MGTPGDAELWIAEACLRVGDPECALTEARAAVKLLESATGAGSREVAIAQMVEGLALAASGEAEEGRRLLDAAFVEPNRTPWGAWLFGRFHEAVGSTAKAKDAYLLACHNGQDFALSCYDLARIYDSLEASSVHRRIQREAREHYLRTSPRGHRSQEVRDALER